ncbi:MAG: 3-hydroxyacyl-CoA dehydrogenase [Chloroflexaceae bacterium]|nr:3-hydroxyacyl-CoA dehydrogenase [Chloroflexaceae bacterium]
MYIFKAAVVGAGAMGGAIAQVISYSGLPVVLKDVDEQAVQAGLDHARAIYQERVDKGKMSASDLANKMALIEGSTSYEGFADVDIVVEAIPEKLDLKKIVFAELDKVLPAGAVIVSNTSALPISEMAAATGRADRVAGLHFFNPANVMKLVEIIPGKETTQETIEDIVGFAQTLRKIPVVVKECPGFLVNRILAPYLGEAVFCLQEGAASAEQIDEAMREYGWPMGPFTLADFVGIDISADVAETLEAAYGERMQAPELLNALVQAGRTGYKGGAGFYTYETEPEQSLETLIEQLGTHNPKSVFTTERLMYTLINETARCAEEGIATLPDIDTAMIAGTGMAVDGERMGPLALADKIGIDVIVNGLKEFQAQYGSRFAPAAILEKKVAAGETGVAAGRGFFEYQ